MAGGLLRIEQMYAFVMVDPQDNTEGIPAVLDPLTGMGMPLVGADMKRVDSLRPVVEKMVADTGVEITLCRFEVRTELETFRK